MPHMCFSYQPDLPPGIGTHAAAPPALRDPRRMPFSCFAYQVDVLQPAQRGWLHCFCYSVDAPQSAQRGWLGCFSYSVDAPQPAPPGLRRMPYSSCFRY
jgi:hypothetical protein